MPPVGCRVASVLGIGITRQGGSRHTCRKQRLLETHVPAHTWYSMMTMIAVPAASRISNTCDAAVDTQNSALATLLVLSGSLTPTQQLCRFAAGA